MTHSRIYRFTFENLSEPEGSIGLKRISLLAHHLVLVARGALLVRIAGSSRAKPDPLINIEKALYIELVKLRKGGTVLELKTFAFAHTLWHLQFSIFDGLKEEELLQKDPISLAIDVLLASVGHNGYENLDADLVKDVLRLHRVFQNHNERLKIRATEGGIKLGLGKAFFEKIRRLEKIVANPEKCLITGTIEEIQFSKAQIKLQTGNGMLIGRLSQGQNQVIVSENWGKNVTVSGTAFYKPNGGVLYVEIDQIEPEASLKPEIDRQTILPI